MITEEKLLNNGYKKHEINPCDDNYRLADRFYQKNLSKDPVKAINVYYYDKFKNDGGLDYDFEFELVEEHDNFWEKRLFYCIDKEMPLEKIEEMILCTKKNEEWRFLK